MAATAMVQVLAAEIVQMCEKMTANGCPELGPWTDEYELAQEVLRLQAELERIRLSLAEILDGVN